MSFLWWLLPVAAILSGVLTGFVRRYVIARNLLDVPNARSSHSIPTPRGGGVAIVVTFLLALSALGFLNAMAWSDVVALGGAGALVACVGFIDDHGHIPARWRLLSHFAAAAWALFWIGGAPPLAAFGSVIDLKLLGLVPAAFFLVWMLNLYNFMDGIDGIASVEAICVGVGGAVLYMVVGHPALAIAPLVLAATVAGFLFWNFPPAKIFMGDVGSGFLGLLLGVLALQAAWVQPSLFWSWAILLGVFIVDATFTLVRRLLSGERVYEAHRSHAYQFAAQRYKGHRPVAIAVCLINLFWLLPIAIAVGLGYIDEIYGIVLACIPLVLMSLTLEMRRRKALR